MYGLDVLEHGASPSCPLYFSRVGFSNLITRSMAMAGAFIP